MAAWVAWITKSVARFKETDKINGAGNTPAPLLFWRRVRGSCSRCCFHGSCSNLPALLSRKRKPFSSTGSLLGMLSQHPLVALAQRNAVPVQTLKQWNENAAACADDGTQFANRCCLVFKKMTLDAV